MGTDSSKPSSPLPMIPNDSRPKVIMLGDSTLDNIVWGWFFRKLY